MRFIRVFLAILIFFLAVIFVVQNSDFLGETVQLRMDLFVLPVQKTIPLPFYFIVLVAFLLGGLLAIAFLLLDRIRLGLGLTSARRRIKHLERELNNLRTLPLTTGSSNALNDEKSDSMALPPFPENSDTPDDEPGVKPVTSI